MEHSGELIIVLMESIFVILFKLISKSHTTKARHGQGWRARVRIGAGDAIGRIPAEMCPTHQRVCHSLIPAGGRGAGGHLRSCPELRSVSHSRCCGWNTWCLWESGALPFSEGSGLADLGPKPTERLPPAPPAQRQKILLAAGSDGEEPPSEDPQEVDPEAPRAFSVGPGDLHRCCRGSSPPRCLRLTWRHQVPGLDAGPGNRQPSALGGSGLLCSPPVAESPETQGFKAQVPGPHPAPSNRARRGGRGSCVHKAAPG